MKNKFWVALLIGFFMVILFLIGFASTSTGQTSLGNYQPEADAQVIGQVSLPYSSGDHIVYIEDVSPDHETIPEGDQTRYASKWGMVNSIAISGKEDAFSPACNYSSYNGDVLVQHVAVVGSSEHLKTFYLSDNDWKAVDIFEKTGVPVAREQPTCWTVEADSVLLENIAARTTGGHVHVFTWHEGSDWTATNLTDQLRVVASSPTTSWNAPAGDTFAEHIAFRDTNNDLSLFWRFAGGTWGKVNVSSLTGKQIAGTPTGWNMQSKSYVERIGVSDNNDHLILFTYTPTENWSAEDISNQTGGLLLKGRVTAWDHNLVQYIAGRSLSGRLHVFSEGIDGWNVEDVTEQTGHFIAADPASWTITSGETMYFHMVAPDSDGDILHFYRAYNDEVWSVENISEISGIITGYPLTAWFIDKAGFLPIEKIAATDPDGHLQVISRSLLFNWSGTDITERSAGRVVYIGAPFSGVWISRDYGVSFEQSAQPQPAVDDAKVLGSMISPFILDIAVSQANPNKVIAIIDKENRNDFNNGSGIYYSGNGGETWELRHQFKCPKDHITELVSPSQILFAPDDPNRVYVAGGCSIVRSLDSGYEWQDLAPWSVDRKDVWHLAVSGIISTNPYKRYLIACGDSNMWVSPDDGTNWYQDLAVTRDLPHPFCQKTGWRWHDAYQLALVPNDPTTIYLAVDDNANGPSYFHKKDHGEGPDGTYCNHPVVIDENDDGFYDLGDTMVFGWKPQVGTELKSQKIFTFNDKATDNHPINGILDDDESVINDHNENEEFDQGEIHLRYSGELKNGTTLIRDSRIKYAVLDRDFGSRRCGEGSLWKGDLSKVIGQTGNKEGVWSQLPGPPVYFGAGSSGVTYVYTHSMDDGYITFFSDSDALHVAENEPTVDGWHWLDGKNASAANRDGDTHVTQYVHVDPQGFAVSPDFKLTLKPVTDLTYPYDQNSELEGCYGGRLWVINDGGMYVTENCGVALESWESTYSGLHTHQAWNIAGTADFDRPPFLYFGTMDNDDFHSQDDGNTWTSAYGSICGDCDTWHGDLFQENRILVLQPRGNNKKGTFELFTNPIGIQADAGPGAKPTVIDYHDGIYRYTGADNVKWGYRPVIQSLLQETPPADGDYIVIQSGGIDDHYLLRANNSISTGSFMAYGNQIPTRTPDPDPAKTLPIRDLRVQAAGGHQSTNFYVNDGKRLYRSEHPVNSWREIIPNGTISEVNRFFVNPYDPAVIYVMNDTGIYISTDYGDTWDTDEKLTNALTDNGAWNLTCNSGDNCPLQDMVFDPTLSTRRFAAGVAGVFFTADGTNWFRLLDTRAIPSRPVYLWFNPLTFPDDDSLYVATWGRGILKIHPIPRTPPDAPPPHPTSTSLPTPIPSPTPAGSGQTLILNGSFESGLNMWKWGGATTVQENFGNNGRSSARLGDVPLVTDTLSQDIQVPCDVERLILSYYIYITSEDYIPPVDEFTVSINGNFGSKILQSLTEDDPRGAWYRYAHELGNLACHHITLQFMSRPNHSYPTSFYVDDVYLSYFNGLYKYYLPVVRK